MAEYRLTPAAQQNLDDIFDQSVAEWGLSVTIRYTEELEAAFVMLADELQLGPSCEKIRPGYSQLRVGSHIVYHKAMGYGVAIIRILHQRMDALRHLRVLSLAR